MIACGEPGRSSDSDFNRSELCRGDAGPRGAQFCICRDWRATPPGRPFPLRLLASAVTVPIPLVGSRISIFVSPQPPREMAMRFPKTLTFLILATGLIVAPFAGAQQKNVGPSSAGPRPNAVRPYVACAALQGGGAVAAVSDRRTAVGTPPLQNAERRSALQGAALQGGAAT